GSSMDFRPTEAMTVSIQPSYNASDSRVQYLQAQTDAAATTTFGRQYVFSEVKQYTLDLTTRLNITFRPNLSLQLYTQPFIATGDYHNLKGLARASSVDYVIYGRGNGSTLRCFNAKDLAETCTTPSSISYYVADP